MAHDGGSLFSARVAAIRDDPSHGICHNGNDHGQGPLSNCPRCVADVLLDELVVARGEVARLRLVLARKQAFRTDLHDV